MTLENKLGITSSAELATQEERLSKKRALELFESGMLDKAPSRHCRRFISIFLWIFTILQARFAP